jgi:DnaK suppressor protein
MKKGKKTKVINIKKNGIENIKEFKEKLLNLKMEIFSSLNNRKKTDVEKDIGDEIDDVVQTMEKEMMFDLSSNEKNILKDIENALKKIEKGNYGICELCGKKIEYKRLKHIPYARYCIECQKKQDK